MKLNSLKYLAVMILSAAVSCGKETPITEEIHDGQLKKMTFEISSAVDTRTEIDENDLTAEGNFKIHWVLGDKIMLYDGTDVHEFVVTSVGGDKSSATSANSAVITGECYDSGTYHAIYPASAYKGISGNYFEYSIPTDQTVSPGTFDPSANVSVAKMETVGGKSRLMFRNVGTRLRIVLNGDYVGSVESLSLYSKWLENGTMNVGYNLAGSAKSDFTSSSPSAVPTGSDLESIVRIVPESGSFEAGVPYYLCLNPVVLSNQYDFVIANNKNTERRSFSYSYKENNVTAPLSRSKYYEIALTPSAPKMNISNKFVLYAMKYNDSMTSSGYTSGPLTGTDPTVLLDGVIDTAEKMQYFITQSDAAGWNRVRSDFTLGADITVDENYTPFINEITVDLDGNGHTIYYGDKPRSRGLFGNLNNNEKGMCKISNLNIQENITSSEKTVSGFVQQIDSDTKIENCSFSGKIVSTYRNESMWDGAYVGGFVANHQSGEGLDNIVGCKFTGSIEADTRSARVGGIAGNLTANGGIVGCSVGSEDEPVELTGYYVGGIVGMLQDGYLGANEVSKDNNVTNATIKGKVVGGIAGKNNSKVVVNSNVSSSKIGDGTSIWAGGLCGESEGNDQTPSFSGCSVSNVEITAGVNTTSWSIDGGGAGGLVGYISSGIVKNCSVDNSVIGVGSGNTLAGGFAAKVRGGTYYSIEDCNSLGITVNASDYAGGLVGYSENGNGYSSCSIDAVSVNASKFAGGFAGFLSSQDIKNSSFTGTSIGKSTTTHSAGFVGQIQYNNGSFSGSTVTVGSILGVSPYTFYYRAQDYENRDITTAKLILNGTEIHENRRL